MNLTGMLAPHSRGRITIDPTRIRPDSLDSLEQYSHIWVVFIFHLNTNTKVVQKAAAAGYQTFPSKVSPPALGGKKVGVFATRTPHRPNPIGFSLCKIDRVDQKQFCIHVSGLDLVDGTPVLDVKPFVPHYDCVGFDVDNIPNSLRLPDWVTSGLDKRRLVVFSSEAEQQLAYLVEDNVLQFYGGKISKHETSDEAYKNVRSCIIEVLAADVRSGYQTKKARKGKSQAERALLKQSERNNGAQKLSHAGEPVMCTQQIDNLLIHFTTELDFSSKGENNTVSSPGVNSGCDDRVVVHKVEMFLSTSCQ
mmetsp:Transcript_6085/g.8860  ORF Transcript_6085/g.8860 Transcript_6085/m.8860 type:complete len:307 (-) Transcript_6085:121-1041(-)